MKTIIALLMCTNLAIAQSVYEIPFPQGTSASKGNTIELAVANSSALTAEGVKVEVTDAPEWLKFTEKIVALPALKAKEEQTACFSFNVEKAAKVNTEQTLSFTITDKSGQQWKKEIKIRVAAPTTYELFQNYPNPFNPTTIIEYQIPPSPFSKKGERGGFVSLKVYDILGREVANLVNEQQEPGGYQAKFDARRYASGMYIYRLIATDEQENQHVFQKKMMLLR
jgi:hypothetical protein